MKTVVGCLLNFRGTWAAMEPAMRQAPHFKPPQHPVLYLKPANTWRRDGFCPIGPMVPRGALRPDALVLRAYVNRVLGAEHTTADLMRPVARLIAQITDFMTLEPGDVLLVGVPENMPRARAGDQMTVEIDGVGRVTNTLRAAGAAS